MIARREFQRVEITGPWTITFSISIYSEVEFRFLKKVIAHFIIEKYRFLAFSNGIYTFVK